MSLFLASVLASALTATPASVDPRLSILDAMKEELERNKKGGQWFLREEVTEEDIAAIVSKWTGIPVTRLMEGEMQKLVRLEDVLHERVIGQDDAVTAVANGQAQVTATIEGVVGTANITVSNSYPTSAAVTVAGEEFSYPVLMGFKWNPIFFGMNAAPISGLKLSHDPQNGGAFEPDERGVGEHQRHSDGTGEDRRRCEGFQ